MPRKKIPQKELPRFLEDLEKAGARGIRRSSPNVHGFVTVHWQQSLSDEEEHGESVQAWKPVYALHAIFIVIVIALAVMALLVR